MTKNLLENPAETMRCAAKLISERVAAVEAEMADRETWYRRWGPADSPDEAWHQSLSTFPGPGGEAAAAFDLSTQRAIATWLKEEAVNAPGPGEVYLRGGRYAYALAVAIAYLGGPPPDPRGAVANHAPEQV